MAESPRSGSKSGLNNTTSGGGPGVNPIVLAFRLEKVEAELKKMGLVGSDMMEMQDKISKLQNSIAELRKEMQNNVTSNQKLSISPARSEEIKLEDPYKMANEEKKAILKRRGKIL